MAIDAEAKRLEAAESIRATDNLVTIHRATYTGDVRTGTAELVTYAIVERYTPSAVNGQNILTGDVLLTMAALVWDAAAAAWGAPLALAHGDVVEVGGKKLVVLDPGALEPSGVAILYEAHAGTRRDAGRAARSGEAA